MENATERGRENMGVFLNFRFQFFEIPKSSLGDFPGVDADGFIGDAGVGLQMFPKGLLACRKL